MNIDIERRLFTVMLISLCMIAQVSYCSCSDGWSLKEDVLKSKGFSVETKEDLIKASKNGNYVIRYMALQLLEKKYGKLAIPGLKESINDSHVKVRLIAAKLLAGHNDKSGLQRMQQDFQELVPRGGAAEPNDPAILHDTNKLERWKGERMVRVKRALEVGSVLIDLGDLRAYDLAAAEGMLSKYAGTRRQAIEILFKVAQADEAALSEKGLDPLAVIIAITQNETSDSLLRAISQRAHELEPSKALIILEEVNNSEYISQIDKEINTRRIKKIKSQPEDSTFEIKVILQD